MQLAQRLQPVEHGPRQGGQLVAVQDQHPQLAQPGEEVGRQCRQLVVGQIQTGQRAQPAEVAATELGESLAGQPQGGNPAQMGTGYPRTGAHAPADPPDLRHQCRDDRRGAVADEHIDPDGEGETGGIAVGVDRDPGIQTRLGDRLRSAGDRARTGIEGQAGGQCPGEGIVQFAVAAGGEWQGQGRDGVAGKAIHLAGNHLRTERGDMIGLHTHDQDQGSLVGAPRDDIRIRDRPGQPGLLDGGARRAGQGTCVGVDRQPGRQGAVQGIAEAAIAAGGGRQGQGRNGTPGGVDRQGKPGHAEPRHAIGRLVIGNHDGKTGAGDLAVATHRMGNGGGVVVGVEVVRRGDGDGPGGVPGHGAEGHGTGDADSVAVRPLHRRRQRHRPGRRRRQPGGIDRRAALNHAQGGGCQDDLREDRGHVYGQEQGGLVGGHRVGIGIRGRPGQRHRPGHGGRRPGQNVSPHPGPLPWGEGGCPGGGLGETQPLRQRPGEPIADETVPTRGCRQRQGRNRDTNAVELDGHRHAKLRRGVPGIAVSHHHGETTARKTMAADRMGDGGSVVDVVIVRASRHRHRPGDAPVRRVEDQGTGNTDLMAVRPLHHRRHGDRGGGRSPQRHRVGGHAAFTDSQGTRGQTQQGRHHAQHKTQAGFVGGQHIVVRIHHHPGQRDHGLRGRNARQDPRAPRAIADRQPGRQRRSGGQTVPQHPVAAGGRRQRQGRDRHPHGIPLIRHRPPAKIRHGGVGYARGIILDNRDHDLRGTGDAAVPAHRMTEGDGVIGEAVRVMGHGHGHGLRHVPGRHGEGQGIGDRHLGTVRQILHAHRHIAAGRGGQGHGIGRRFAFRHIESDLVNPHRRHREHGDDHQQTCEILVRQVVVLIHGRPGQRHGRGDGGGNTHERAGGVGQGQPGGNPVCGGQRVAHGAVAAGGRRQDQGHRVPPCVDLGWHLGRAEIGVQVGRDRHAQRQESLVGDPPVVIRIPDRQDQRDVLDGSRRGAGQDACAGIEQQPVGHRPGQGIGQGAVAAGGRRQRQGRNGEPFGIAQGRDRRQAETRRDVIPADNRDRDTEVTDVADRLEKDEICVATSGTLARADGHGLLHVPGRGGEGQTSVSRDHKHRAQRTGEHSHPHVAGGGSGQYHGIGRLAALRHSDGGREDNDLGCNPWDDQPQVVAAAGDEPGMAESDGFQRERGRNGQRLAGEPARHDEGGARGTARAGPVHVDRQRRRLPDGDPCLAPVPLHRQIQQERHAGVAGHVQAFQTVKPVERALRQAADPVAVQQEGAQITEIAEFGHAADLVVAQCEGAQIAEIAEESRG